MTAKLQFQAPLESLLQKNALTRWSHISPIFGDDFYTLDGEHFKRGQPLPKGQRLPAMFKPKEIVAGDLIPNTSWGSSLSNMLTKGSWDKLRIPLIEKNNNVCQICGTRHASLDVHEVWSYALPSQEEIWEAQDMGAAAFGIQRLDDLMAICKECHKMFHLGFANVNNELDAVLSRLAAVNGWSQEQVSSYSDLVGKRYEDASEAYWALDFTNIQHPDGGLTLKANWGAMKDEPRLLESEGRFGQQVTALLGIPWKHYKDTEWSKVVTLQDFES
jgi:hypothetical protein